MSRSTVVSLIVLALLLLVVAALAMWRPREVATITKGVVEGQWLEAYSIPSGSMRPTLEVGDYILALPGIFADRVPIRGEIAVFWNEKAQAIYVSRIVGLPGDRIQMRNGQLYINGTMVVRERIADFQRSEDGEVMSQFIERLPEGFPHPILEMRDTSALDNTVEVVVPPDSVFLMGDNRDNASDGRVHGATPLEDLKDRPVLIYWSRDWSRIGMTIQ